MRVDNRLKMISGVSLTALVMTLIYFISLNYDLALDGAETTYFGFPLPWNSRATAASLGKEIYVLPLILDVLFWLWVAVQVLKFVEQFPAEIVSGFRLALLALGIYGLALILGMLALNELFFSFLPAPGPFHITAVRPGFGA